MDPLLITAKVLDSIPRPVKIDKSVYARSPRPLGGTEKGRCFLPGREQLGRVTCQGVGARSLHRPQVRSRN